MRQIQRTYQLTPSGNKQSVSNLSPAATLIVAKGGTITLSKLTLSGELEDDLVDETLYAGDEFHSIGWTDITVNGGTGRLLVYQGINS